MHSRYQLLKKCQNANSPWLRKFKMNLSDGELIEKGDIFGSVICLLCNSVVYS